MRKMIQTYTPELTALRHDFHKHPELGFQEERTSGIIAGLLKEWGLEVHTGMAETGVVAVLSNGDSDRSLALRSDMDALPVREITKRAYTSVNEGVMHACGHDGHMAMLLGAARYLSETRRFNGTVYFIFQPAEEGGGGGKLMVQDGLFDRFRIDSIFGLHNRSGLDAGNFSIRKGCIMAATNKFEFTITGRGTHAAMPHTGVDPIVAASEIVTALQSIVSREVRALDSAVVSLTCFSAGTTYNVIPDKAVLKGCTRFQDKEVGEQLHSAMERVISGVSSAHGCRYEFEHIPGYPALINSDMEVEIAAEAAINVSGAGKVDTETQPLMASEDFAFYLDKVPGAYIFLGNGKKSISHRADYDFNDEIIPVGVAYWASLAELVLCD